MRIEIIESDFFERVGEINRYIQLLESIEGSAQLIFPNDGDRRERLNVRLSSTLKSGLILLLYNLIESTVSKCLDGIHEVISEEGVTYFQMSNELQQLWLKHHYSISSKGDLSNRGGIGGHLQAMIAVLTENKTVSISDNESKALSKSLYSGNLDDVEIKKIMKKYGIELMSENTSSMITVRRKRNQLAHGEVSFEEGCRDNSIQQMNIIKNDTVNFMKEFINVVKGFISNKNYRGSDAHPTEV